MGGETGAALGPPPVGACRQGKREGGRCAICALPGVEHNHYLRHGVAMTPEIILETIFCEMPLKCKIQCLLSAGAALLSSWGSLANRFTDEHSLNFKSSDNIGEHHQIMKYIYRLFSLDAVLHYVHPAQDQQPVMWCLYLDKVIDM